MNVNCGVKLYFLIKNSFNNLVTFAKGKNFMRFPEMIRV